MDKEDVVCVCVCVCIHNGIIFNHKKKLTCSFVVMWMNLESVIQSEVRKRKANIVYYPI